MSNTSIRLNLFGMECPDYTVTISSEIFGYFVQRKNTGYNNSLKVTIINPKGIVNEKARCI